MTDLERAREALHTIPPDLPREEWVRVGMAAHAAGLDFDVFDQWSAGGASYEPRAALCTWRSFKHGGGIGAGTLFAIAMQHGAAIGRAPVPYRPNAPFVRPAAPARHETLSEYGRELCAACRPAHGAALAYLEARHCAIPPEDGDLRFHAALKHPSGYVGPALVALVTDILTREPISLHRTWINPDGSKADVDPPRLLLGGHRKQGGVIRLWPDESVTYGLGIAEGIETSLTLAHARAPVWSLIDAGNLADFPLLAGIECLTIAADHDDAGIRAATACADRWALAGCDVRVVIPPRAKSDLNDVVRESA